MSQQYRAANPNDLILHELDSMTLVFHKPSGITHVVADPVPAILEVLEGRVLSAGDVGNALSNNFQLDDETELEAIVLARLEELCDLGLVEKVALK